MHGGQTKSADVVEGKGIGPRGRRRGENYRTIEAIKRALEEQGIVFTEHGVEHRKGTTKEE